MSASLVGSEMCIRDSSHLAHFQEAAAPPLRAARGAPTKGRAEANRGAPVSYTHLTLPTICSV
eukprot:5493969-Alexandrium_andersonii.AAC.1